MPRVVSRASVTSLASSASTRERRSRPAPRAASETPRTTSTDKLAHVDLLVPEDEGPADFVLELPNVAGPGKRQQLRHGSARDPSLHAIRVLLDEVLDEPRDVVGPLSQRRHSQSDDVDPVEEILTKSAGCHERDEIPVGRSNEPHIHLVRSFAAHGSELPVLQNAQQLRLHGERHLTDFVEKQRSPIGDVEQPGTRSDSPR